MSVSANDKLPWDPIWLTTYLEISFGHQKVSVSNLETFEIRIDPIPLINVWWLVGWYEPFLTWLSMVWPDRKSLFSWNPWRTPHTGRRSASHWTESSVTQQTRLDISPPSLGMLSPDPQPSVWSVWRWGGTGCRRRRPGETWSISRSLRRGRQSKHWRICRLEAADS